jgi:hypothetical protein
MFKVYPPSTPAENFNSVNNNLCYTFDSAVDMSIYSYDGENNMELIVEIQAGDITEGQFTQIPYNIAGLSEELTIVIMPSSLELKKYFYTS